MGRGQSDESDRTGSGNRTLLGRREYVRMGAAAVAATAGASALPVASANSDDYEVISLSRGEQRAYTLSDGEVFENVLIDQTAAGSMFSLRMAAGANDWVIRNVGWKGVAPTGGARDYVFLINARGNGAIENVFIDQRDHSGTEGSDVGGIWTYSNSHNGHIECSHNFIAGCGNNASYTSGDGWDHYDGTGTIEHYRSYHRDNTVSNFRPGRPGSVIKECVSVNNDPGGTRGTYPSTSSRLSRAVWGWHSPDMLVEDCAIWQDPSDVSPAQPFWATHRSGSEFNRCEVTVRNCDINASWENSGGDLVPSGHGGSGGSRSVVIEGLGTNPDVSILGDGVPTTAEMAAAGERALPPELGTAPSGGHGDRESTSPSNGSIERGWTYSESEGVHTDLPWEFVVEHVEPGTTVSYAVEFDEGEVEVGEWEYNAELDGNTAIGHVGPQQGLDNLYFDCKILDLTAENASAAEFLLADAQTREVLEVVEPSDFPREEQPGEGSGDDHQRVENGDDDTGNDDGNGDTLTTGEANPSASPPWGRIGIVSGLASFGAVGYYLKQRYENDEI